MCDCLRLALVMSMEAIAVYGVPSRSDCTRTVTGIKKEAFGHEGGDADQHLYLTSHHGQSNNWSQKVDLSHLVGFT